jgi:hypothetical protein
MKKYIFPVIVIFLFLRCAPGKTIKGDKAEDLSGTVELIITPMVSGKPLFMDTVYASPDGGKYSLKTLRFFLSNIALAKSIGEESAAVPETPTGVYLIDFNNPDYDAGHGLQSCKITFKVKPGQYSDIRLNVGVPRQLNHADPATAKFPLDLGRGNMYWDWNSGYIFLLAEGKGPEVYKNNFHFAVGSDSRMMSFSFGNLFNVVPLIQVEKNKTTRIHFTFDFNKLLINGDGSIYSFKYFESATVHGGYYADKLSLNAINTLKFISSEIQK